MLTKDQLLNTRRRTHPLQVQDFPEPLLLAEPSAALGMKVRGMRAKGEDLDSAEGMQLILSDMVVDADGRPMLTPEEVPALLERLSVGALTAIFMKFVELYAAKAPASAADAVPSKPSTSAG